MIVSLLKCQGLQLAEMLLGGKYPQKFVFNFIRVFTTTQDVSFNELNIRKCLTVKIAVGSQHKSLLQSL